MPPQAKRPTFVRTKDLAAAHVASLAQRPRRPRGTAPGGLHARVLAALRSVRVPLDRCAILKILGHKGGGRADLDCALLALSDAGLVVVKNDGLFAAEDYPC